MLQIGALTTVDSASLSPVKAKESGAKLNPEDTGSCASLRQSDTADKDFRFEDCLKRKTVVDSFLCQEAQTSYLLPDKSNFLRCFGCLSPARSSNVCVAPL